ncbi:MAG TPA: c-type cytochrome, partial [Candidatus Polarisedimenticolia bacterium]|nr:c-type cytochrome [Candidatus Polarisedimenticolia bacterium]
NLTNVSSGDVTIFSVTTSCHCTVAELPSTPWKLSPNENGTISATMDLFDVPPGGDKTKTLTVSTDKGQKFLYAKAIVLPGAMATVDRTNAQKIAMANRQAVFRGDCASCHVAPAKDATGHDKMGKDLYVAVCGICHDAEHRASFVPDLHHLTEPTNPDFWRSWIAHGKPGTLMPAFSRSEGGFLTEAQIGSLVVFLNGTISPHPAGAANPAK